MTESLYIKSHDEADSFVLCVFYRRIQLFTCTMTMDYEHPTPREVRRAARAAITILNDNDFSCCLFGSLACHIYGVKYRDPKVRASC